MSTTLKWGLITGMVYVIFSLVSNMMGLQQGGGGSAAVGFLVNCLLLVATFFTLYMGVKEKRDQDQNGYMTFGEGFKSGMGIALIAAVIAAVFTFIYMKFIDPDMGDRIMEGVQAQWEKSGMPEDQQEVAKKWMGYMFNPFIMFAFMMAYVIFWGLIKSLIAGAMLKKEAPPTVPTA